MVENGLDHRIRLAEGSSLGRGKKKKVKKMERKYWQMRIRNGNGDEMGHIERERDLLVVGANNLSISPSKQARSCGFVAFIGK